MNFFSHRGASGDQVENTMVAFAAALRAGFDGFECDLRMTGDNTVVCVHDGTLTRTHKLPTKVTHLSDSDLPRLGIPTLDQVIQRFASSRIIFDVKDERCLPVLAHFFTSKTLKPCLHWVLLWNRKWKQPSLSCFHARNFVFRTTSDFYGIACKYSGSPQNVASIRHALGTVKHVNLFTADADLLDDMLAFADSHGCSVTI
jgi:glycerophosphoryl diester phosphodiesterase